MHVACVSMCLESKERPVTGLSVFSRRENGASTKIRKKGVGEGNEGNACRQTSGF